MLRGEDLETTLTNGHHTPILETGGIDLGCLGCIYNCTAQYFLFLSLQNVGGGPRGGGKGKEDRALELIESKGERY